MFSEFSTTTYGKWILAGEHAVLRGHGALVFPMRHRQLTLSYQPANGELSADYQGDSGADMHLLFWSVLEHGQQLLGSSLNRLSGHFHLDCNIPIGVGMGASAALCVAMARWFAAQQLITPETIPLFAKNLEDLFHGKSSGLDIAGTAAESGIYFKQGKATNLPMEWIPHWYLSASGQIGITAHCIKQVKELWQKNRPLAEKVDIDMQQAVDYCQQGLRNASLNLLTKGIQQAADCFKTWGLISGNLEKHMDSLLQQGARAVKPTGSGGGGFVLSLWESPPNIPQLIAL